MNIYIEHEKKFYDYPGTWDEIKNYNGTTVVGDFLPEHSTDNPPFALGDRVYFEDLKEWTEVYTGWCIEGELHKKICGNVGDSSEIIFRKLPDSTEPEKSPEPEAGK